MAMSVYHKGKYKYFIYKDAPDGNEAQRNENIKNKVIDNQQILFIGGTGSGKTMASESYQNELKNHGYKIIVLTEKPNYEFESAFSMFPIKDDMKHKYHLNILKSMGVEPLSKEECRNLVKLYHPFTHNLGINSMSGTEEKLLPQMELFSFPLKSITENGFSALLVGNADAETVRTCVNIVNDIKDTDSIWDFLLKIHSQIKDKKEGLYNYDPKKMIPVPTSGTQTTINKISDSFSVFRDHYFIHSKRSSMNLNMVRILNDQKHISVFSTKWIPEKRLKYFTIIMTLEEIFRAIASNKVKYPLCIVLEEIRILLPSTTDISYEKILATILYNMLLTVRRIGTTIATTQFYARTNKDVRNSFSMKFIGKCSEGDTNKFQEDATFKQAQIDRINSLNVGEFIWWEECLKGEEIIHAWDLPPFSHAEENENFFDKYKEEYPELLTDYTPLKLEMLNERNVIEEKLKEQWNSMASKSDNKSYKAQSAVDKERKRADSAINSLKDKEKEIILKTCYDMRNIRNEKGKRTSFRAIAKQHGISSPTAKEYAKKYAMQISDNAYLGESENL
jgi:hypothetical protein